MRINVSDFENLSSLLQQWYSWEWWRFKRKLFPKKLFTYVENHEDAYELSEAEGHTEFERGKGRDHSRATLPRKRIGVVEKLRPDDVGNAGDVDIPGGEGGGHRGLSHWKRYAWKDIGIDTLEYLKNLNSGFKTNSILPAWAVFSAPQSLQPSPHMITCRLHFDSSLIWFLDHF